MRRETSSPSWMRQRTIPRSSVISYSGTWKRSSTSGRPDHDDRALLVGVGHADDPQRHAAEVLPVGAGEPLEVHRLPQRQQLVLGHVDVGRLDRAHRPVRVHHGVLLGIGDHRVGDPSLALAVEQLHRAARTASSKPSGCVVEARGRVLLDQHLGAEAVDERLHQPVGDRGEEGHPVGRQARREHGYSDDDGRAAAQERCGAAHHLTIGEDVLAAELDLGRGVVEVRQVGERGHDVLERDRLRLGVQPLRADHHRQLAEQVLEDVVGGAARADDHRRAHVDEPVAAGGRAAGWRPRGASAGARSSRCRARRGRRPVRRWRAAASAKLTAAWRSLAAKSPPEPIECTR